MTTNDHIMGSALADDLINGTDGSDITQGLAGNDTIHGNAGDDVLYGDYANVADLNALQAGTAGTTMEAYGTSKAWDFYQAEDGHSELTQIIETEAKTSYTLTLDLAANMAAGTAQSAVNIIWNGQILETVDVSSGAFNTHTVTLQGVGGLAELKIQTVEPVATKGPVINTDGPIMSYDHTVTVNGAPVVVQAFAEGQSNIYQVLNGTLNTFDVDKGTYTVAGSKATVNVNAIGFNTEDNLIYGIASADGVDALGNAVKSADLVMLDATGNSYGMGSTPYRSWTGDFDDKGNLWAFQSSMDRITVIDVSETDATGNPVSKTFKFPASLVTKSVYDVAYDAATESFYGVVRSSADGATTVMMQIDVSKVQDGGEPIFNMIPVTETEVDGTTVAGVPKIAFGAAVLDADGNFYVGGNSGNHDLDDATGRKGGIYQVVTDEKSGTAKLVLMADAPGVGANDGAADPRSTGLVNAPASTQSTLIRDVSLTPVVDQGFDDTINGGGGQDLIDGSVGVDELIGDAQGDTLKGGDGNDALYGGAGPNWTDNGLISVYDDQGNRYDQFGNLLPEDDDTLFGGAGDDALSGSAGHDTLDGGQGNDTLKGGSGFDTLFGAEGNDSLYGGGHEDILWGGDGDDLLIGGSGHDDMSGGRGVDTLKGGSGNDTLNGDTGNDILEGGSNDDTLNGGFGEDSLKGGSGNDILNGGNDADFMDGGSGNDTLQGGSGRDVMKGNSGDDEMDGGDDRDTMNGGSGNDMMFGDDGNDYLAGGKGNDVLEGGNGNDRIRMGEGNDIATGGAGSDTFFFKSDDVKGGQDLITDFDTAQDTLNFQALDLDANGASTTDWFAQNVSMTTGQAVIQVGDSVVTVTLDDTVQSSELYDAMVF